MTMPPLNELLAFQKVATLLSFNKASAELNLTPSTLSHLVRSLEERLKTRLFNRTTRSVSLTEAGQKLLPQINTIFRDLRQALDLSADNKPNGTVRINTSDPGALILFEKIGLKLRDKFPDVHLELIVDNHPIDIVADGFDAGVRLKKLIPKDMVAVPIVDDFRFVTVASPAYIKKHGRPKKPSDLLDHNCLGFRLQNGKLYEWQYKKLGKKTTVPVQGTMTTNNPSLLMDAVKKGIGIAHFAEPLIKKDVASNELIVLLEDWSPEHEGLYLYYPKNRHTPSALRAIINILLKRHL